MNYDLENVTKLYVLNKRVVIKFKQLVFVYTWFEKSNRQVSIIDKLAL